jgi:hypothetical protein
VYINTASSTCSFISYAITQQSLFQSKAFPWFQEFA